MVGSDPSGIVAAPEPPLDTRVYVGNLPWSCEDSHLSAAFSPVGAVKEARIIFDRESQRSKGFGFVTFETAEDANRAIEMMNGAEIGGRQVKVGPAAAPGTNPNPTRSRRSGGDPYGFGPMGYPAPMYGGMGGASGPGGGGYGGGGGRGGGGRGGRGGGGGGGYGGQMGGGFRGQMGGMGGMGPYGMGPGGGGYMGGPPGAPGGYSGFPGPSPYQYGAPPSAASPPYSGYMGGGDPFAGYPGSGAPGSTRYGGYGGSQPPSGAPAPPPQSYPGGEYGSGAGAYGGGGTA